MRETHERLHFPCFKVVIRQLSTCEIKSNFQTNCLPKKTRPLRLMVMALLPSDPPIIKLDFFATQELKQKKIYDEAEKHL